MKRKNNLQRDQKEYNIGDRIQIVELIKSAAAANAKSSRPNSIQNIIIELGYSITVKDYRYWLANLNNYYRLPVSKRHLYRLPNKCTCVSNLYCVMRSNDLPNSTDLVNNILNSINSVDFNDEQDTILNSLNETKDVMNEGKRYMNKLDESVENQIKLYIQSLFPNHSISNDEILLLKSDAELQQQIFHTDFDNEYYTECSNCSSYHEQYYEDTYNSYKSDVKKNYSFVFAIESNTSIIMYRNSNKHMKITLNVGDLIIWKDSTLHAGADYSQVNRRVFGMIIGNDKIDWGDLYNIKK